MVDVTYLRPSQAPIAIGSGSSASTTIARWVRKWRKPIGLSAIVGIALAQGNVIGMWLVGLIPLGITDPVTYLAGAGTVVGAPLICNIVRWSRFK